MDIGVDLAEEYEMAEKLATVSISVEQDQLKIVNLQDAAPFDEGDEWPAVP